MKSVKFGKPQDCGNWGSLGTLVVSACLAATLAACGGGGGTANTPASGAAVALSSAGTVNGFGSVYVDGVEIEDANASVTMEMADGSTQNVPLRMGQRVRVKHDGANKASSITVDAAVIGKVAAIDAVANTLTVAGQTVSTNSDSASTAPVTVYGGGYDQFTDIVSGDLVMVFGTPVYASDTKKYSLQASRIEKSDAKMGERLMGTVTKVTSNTSFKVGEVTVDATNATVVPSGSTMTENQSVVLWGEADAYSAPTNTFTATRVRVLKGSLPDGVTSGTLQVSGVASAYDATAKTLSVQGVTVNLASATVTPATKTLGDNSYVDITGTVNADGSLTASTVKIRTSDVTNAALKVLLNGTVESLEDQNNFVVRGVPVDASQATDRVCSVDLAVGTPVYVVATAQSDTNVVLASAIKCQNSSSSTGNLLIRSATGAVSNVNTTDSTFTLTSTSSSGSTSTSSVRWTSQTAFTGGLTTATLSATTTTNVNVRVRGYLDSSGVLVARQIHVVGTDDEDKWHKDRTSSGTGSDSSTGDNASTSDASDTNSNWKKYRERKQRK